MPFRATRCRRASTSGFEYYQEFAPEDDAVDEGKTFAMLDSLTVGATTYRNVLQVLETTAVEPDSREFKYYAPGVGLIRAEEGLDESLSNPELTFDRVEAPVPLPPGLLLLVAALAAWSALRRRAAVRSRRPWRPCGRGRRGRSRPGSACGSSPTRPPSRCVFGVLVPWMR